MIKYLIGDATSPVKTNALICHVCNNAGAWGAGFVLALSRKWKAPEVAYRNLSHKLCKLGVVQFVPISSSTIVVANMIA